MSESPPLERTGVSMIPVILVDDHAIWRGGVRSMLDDTEFIVVGEAGSGKEALEVARRAQPRIVLLDIRMAAGDGLDALSELKREYPWMVVVLLTTYDNPTFVARAAAGGAAAYLLKGVSRAELLSALRTAAVGQSLLTREEVVRSRRSVGPQSADADDLIEPLTPREEEVLGLLATGLRNKEIAPILSIAEGTVKTHVEHIIAKLGVSDRVQAAVWAARHGLASA